MSRLQMHISGREQTKQFFEKQEQHKISPYGKNRCILKNKGDTVACGSVRTNCLSTLCHKSIGAVRCSLAISYDMGDIDDW